jgi:hypothetical protein
LSAVNQALAITQIRKLQNATMNEVRKPRFGESNLAAVVGAAVGAVGGLFAVGIPPAILAHDSARLLATPMLGFIGWFVSGSIGWLIGGQVGPRLELKLSTRAASIVGGVLGGLVPTISIMAWSYYMITSR